MLKASSTTTLGNDSAQSLPLKPESCLATKDKIGPTTDSLTSERVSRILEYLKNVDQSTGGSSSEPCSLTTSEEPVLESDRSASSVFDGVKARLVSQQVEIDNQTQAVNLLKAELQRHKQMSKDQQEQWRMELKSKLTLQRRDYEETIKRHLGFIDKLLKEKEQLTKQCEDLTSDVGKMEKQFAAKFKAMEEQHQRHLKSQKELWQAGEKLRRDKWIQEHTRKIKEQTVKGLEPEIERMLTQHKSQLRQMEESVKAQLQREKDTLVQAHRAQVNELQAKIVSERQRAAEEEREFARQRYQAQFEREECDFNQSKRKLIAQMQEEKELAIAALQEERRTLETNYKRQLEDIRQELQREQSGRTDALDLLQRRHANELQIYRDQIDKEKEEWKQQQNLKKEEELLQREKAVREKLVKERDAEIEMVIARLESESNSNSSDVYRRHRMELERQAAQHADELKTLRDEHAAAIDKLLQAQQNAEAHKQSRDQTQKELLECQTQVVAREKQIKSQLLELEKLRAAESIIEERIRGEFVSNLKRQELQVSQLEERAAAEKAHVNEILLEHKLDLEKVRQEKDQALQMIETRVRQTISMKEQLISQLKKQLGQLQCKCDTLEGIVEKNRRELLLS